MLAYVNPNPRFLRDIVDGGFLDPAPFVLADVGAAGGFLPHWLHFGKYKRLIGFEPNAQEAERLNQNPQEGVWIYPVALGRRKERRVFHHLRNHCCSTFLEINRDYWSRFPLDGIHDEVEASEMETIDLDSYAASAGIGDIDYIKLDTEGTELDILMGAAGLLESSVLAVDVEVAFQPIHQDRPLFGDVDAYMRQMGFALFELSPWRHARRALPPLDTPPDLPSTYGQVVWGQALYMKDLADRIRKGAKPDPFKIIKQAMLFDLYAMPDCAIELLEIAAETGAIDQIFRHGINLLVPHALGRVLPVESWRTLFRLLP